MHGHAELATAAGAQDVSFLLDVSFRRRTRCRSISVATSATSATETVTENVHVREASENINGIKG